MTAPAGGDLVALLAKVRASGDFAPLVDAIPYARFLGLSLEKDGAGFRTRMRFEPHIVGNALIPALHGGAVGSLLESAAIFGLLWETRAEQGISHAPRIINITVEYLRTAKTVDTFARAEITRQGRRIATVRSFAWQDDVEKPVAAANAHFLFGPR